MQDDTGRRVPPGEWRIWDPKSFLNNSKLIALMVLNQPISPNVGSFVKRNWKTAVLRIAVDGGLMELKEICDEQNPLLPDIICGDFDSVIPELLIQYADMGSKVIETPDQDETDFMKALNVCFDVLSVRNIKVDGIITIARNGDRLDHILGNLNTLYHATRKNSVPVLIMSNNSLTWLMESGQHKIHVCQEMLNGHVGLIPLGEPCEDVTTTGLMWNLTRGSMKFGELISTCNRFNGSDCVTIKTDKTLVWTMEIDLK